MICILVRLETGCDQIIVPNMIIPPLLRLMHDPITIAHPDEKGMYATLRLTFYWPRINIDWINHVRNCLECFRQCIRLRRHEIKRRLFPANDPQDELANRPSRSSVMLLTRT